MHHKHNRGSTSTAAIIAGGAVSGALVLIAAVLGSAVIFLVRRAIIVSDPVEHPAEPATAQEMIPLPAEGSVTTSNESAVNGHRPGDRTSQDKETQPIVSKAANEFSDKDEGEGCEVAQSTLEGGIVYERDRSTLSVH